jgi:uncharacterized protein with ParB-like and HNH nuclease domain
MKANAIPLINLLQQLFNQQFVIPVYQRHYSWEKKQCNKLWNDLIRAGTNNNVNAHFIGAVVHIQNGLSLISQKVPFSVIDGQQRLTTGTLLIAALADYLDNHSDNLPSNFSADMLRNSYLFNQHLTGEQKFKLILSETDKDTLLAILQKDLPMPQESSERIIENYQLFQKLISEYSGKLETIYQGLEKLMVVEVILDRLQDDPQMIFESMNSTGMALSQADLIRNYILMNLEPDLQTKLYKTYWQPMENSFKKDYDEHFDPFMRHYLIAKTGDMPNMRGVYDAFKKYASGKDISGLLADISIYAKHYRAMALDAEPDARLKNAFNDLKELKVDVAYPFLLDAYHHYEQNKLTTDELLQIVRWVESYVFRRAICSIPTNSLNKIFATFSTSLKNKDRYFESVQAAFLLQPAASYRRFPSNEDFQRDIKVRDLYNFDRKKYWLRRLENHNRKERVITDEYTIEHVLPQTLSEEWKAELGSDWQDIQEKWLHTLGNLTLTAYNSEYWNNPFEFKQRQATNKKTGDKISLDVSPLQLNGWEFDLEVIDEKTGTAENKKFSLKNVPTWNEVTILARAERLALEATKVWSIPQLAADILDTYRSSDAKQNSDEPEIDNEEDIIE